MNTTRSLSPTTVPDPPARSRRASRLPALVAGAWSALYAALGAAWAFGAPGYPFAAGNLDSLGAALLDPLPAPLGGTALAATAVVSGILTLLLVRRPAHPTFSILAVIVGLFVAVGLTDVRILMTIGYLPMMIGAILTGNLDPVQLTAMVNWPAIDLLILMIAGICLTTLGARPLFARAKRMSPARALRLGQIGVAVSVAVPVVYATTRFGWVLGIPVGLSAEFLQTIAEITPIGAGLATFALLGALLTTGLVRPWGEVWPRWVPVLRGRAIPARLPATAALVVAAPIAAAGLMYVRRMLRGVPIGPPGAELEPGAWLPEMLWPLWAAGLTLAAVTYLIRRGHGLFLSQGR